MIKISASVLTADFSNLQAEILKAEQGGVDMIHLDVMDGSFVPNITFGAPVIKSIRKVTTLPFDVHLMIQNPEKHIQDFAEAGANIITVHAEASTHLHRTIQLIKSFGLKASVALNPSTPVEFVEWIIDDIDMLLQMTVNPGFGGQKYIEAMTIKILKLKEMTIKHCKEIDIQVDGGINENTIKKVTDSGANVIVAGAALFNATNLSDAVDTLRRNSLWKK